MKIFKTVFLSLSLVSTLFVACTTNNTSSEAKKEEAAKEEIKEETVITKSTNPFVNRVQAAHKLKEFRKHSAVKFDIAIMFGGNQVLDATITQQTDSRKALIEYMNGEKIFVNDEKVFVSEGLKDNPGVRFHAYTWSYFFLYPYKMNDQGTVWESYENNRLVDRTFDTHKLTFEEGTGDAPKDWYVAYADQETGVLNYVAYIVTANSTQEEAEKDPHAIQYIDYETVDGVPFAKTWKFWGWTQEKGITDQIGSATLANLSFVETDSAFFNVPNDFIQK